MMNIMLIGERYSPNLGDGVIYDSVENICKKIYGSDANFISFDISGGTSYSINKNNSVSINEKIKTKLSFARRVLSETKRISLIKRRIKKIDFDSIDGAIFVGGQLFSEYFSKPIYIISKELAKNNIPILFNCCGLGKNDKKSYVNYLNKAFDFKNVVNISVRDNYDEFIRKYNVDANNVQLIMDPVVECSEFVQVKKSNDNLFGIGIMDPKLYKKNNLNYSDYYYFELYKNIIKKLDDKKIRWEFFCNGRINDYDYAKKICDRLGISYDKIAARPTSPIELIGLVNKYKSIISFRLHSHIIAYSYGIPSIGFCWDNKVKQFGKSINKEEFFLEINDKTVDSFNKIIDGFVKYKFEKNYNYKLSSEFLKENKFKVKK